MELNFAKGSFLLFFVEVYLPIKNVMIIYETGLIASWYDIHYVLVNSIRYIYV